jgi:hypothetical protein
MTHSVRPSLVQVLRNEHKITSTSCSLPLRERVGVRGYKNQVIYACSYDNESIIKKIKIVGVHL